MEGSAVAVATADSPIAMERLESRWPKSSRNAAGPGPCLEPVQQALPDLLYCRALEAMSTSAKTLCDGTLLLRSVANGPRGVDLKQLEP